MYIISEETSDETNENKDLTINEIIIIDPETTELDLNHGRIGKLENLEQLKCIERLFLRWNLIKKIENLDTLHTLKELELYDNQITVIENLGALVNLEYVGKKKKSGNNAWFLGYWIYLLIELRKLRG